MRVRLLYLLAFVPALTELAERGSLPGSPREAITEIVLGAAIVGLVAFVCRLWDRTLELAERDALTGLLNLRRLQDDLPLEIGRARRTREPLALAWIDLDGFKGINDRLGHGEGDRVLVRVAAAIAASLRGPVDRAYRVGGDEFVLLLPGADAAAAVDVVERIRSAALDVLRPHGASLSAGVVELRDGEEAPELRRRADAMMYRAKEEGRNRTRA